MANGAWAEIREKFQAALALSRVELHKNPEKEPYKSKYGARVLLEEVRALLGPAPEDEDEDERPQAEDDVGAGDSAPGLLAELVAVEGPVAQGAVRLAVIEFHLGLNHLDTEELSAGEEHLMRCLRLVRRYRLAPDCVSLYIQAQNNLGILWSEREEIETAQAYLDSSEALYLRYMKEIGSPPLDPTEHFLPEEEKLTEQERSKSNALWRPGTVYQLLMSFLVKLERTQPQKTDNIGELDLDKQSELRALRKKELDEEESVRKKAVQFGTGELCDAISAVEEKVSYLRPLDFEEARGLFLLGQHYVSEAKEFFQIDGYVTDHIEVVQDHSALFKVLAFFETDMERRCKMHKRRIAMLEPLIVDLNPQYYLLVNRQIQFEIAHAYYDMMDLKVAIADKLRDPDSHIVKKINNLNKSAMKYYQLFLDSLRDPNKVFPEHIGEDVLRPAMLAKFRVARLYGKIITSDPQKELENLATSLEHYKFIVDYCEKHPEAAQEIEVELELSKEMVSLLPTKMERFRTKMALT
ncbi:KIF-binding protein isoform X3 [Myotis myotis]|uniref:KIF-binding protein isoform X3 n=1 Tax=Myotis myotis TaxID=51298 RepID=UPI001748B922|nr:KIF-binding protein isoform X3 [Myotis myotis]